VSNHQLSFTMELLIHVNMPSHKESNTQLQNLQNQANGGELHSTVFTLLVESEFSADTMASEKDLQALPFSLVTRNVVNFQKLPRPTNGTMLFATSHLSVVASS